MDRSAIFHPIPSHDRWIKVTLLLSASFTVMSGAIVAAALPQISEVFSYVPGIEVLSRLLLTLHAIFIALFSPMAGMIADKFGRKKLLVWSLLLYALAGTAGTWMDSLWAILGSRVVLGLAVAGLMTASTTLVADHYQGKARDRFLGLQASAMSFGGVLFISLGGWLADTSWRTPFWVYALTIPLIPLATGVIKEQRDSQRLKIFRNQRLSKNSKLQLLGTYLLILWSMTTFYLAPVQVPFLLNELDPTISSTQVGLALAAMTLIGAITSLFFKRLKAKFSTRALYALSFAALGTGYLFIAAANDLVLVTFGLSVSGIGIGFIMPITNSLVMSMVPQAFLGRAMGWISTFVYSGQFLSPLTSQLFGRSFSTSWPFMFTGVSVLVLALGFLISLVLIRVQTGLK